MKTTEKKLTISRGFAFAPGCLGGTDFNQRIQAYSALLTQWQTPLLETRKQNINRGKANQTETHIYQSETCKYSILNDSKGSNATWHRLQQKQLQYRLTYFRKGLSNWGELRVFYFLDLRSVEKVNIFLTQADPSRTMSVPLIKVPHAWWIFRVKKKNVFIANNIQLSQIFIFFAGLRLSNFVSQFQLLESKFVFIRSFKVLSWKRTLVEKKVQSKNKFPCMFFLSDCCLGQNPGRSPFSHFCFRLVPSAESATTTMSIKFRMKHLLRWCTQPCQHLR